MQCTESEEKTRLQPVSRAWAIGLIGLAVLLLYGRTLGYGLLVGDDTVNITYNPYFSPLTAANISKAWSHAYFDLFIPVTLSIWFFLQSLARPGLPPEKLLHAANLLFHWANGALVFLLACKVLDTPARTGWSKRLCLPELACALFFVCHPLQVPVTAWISGMRDLAGTFFSLLALLAVVRADPTAAIKNGSLALQARSFAVYALAALLFVLALLSKPSTVCLPVLALIVSVMLERRWRPVLAALVPWLFAAALVSWATMGLQATMSDRFAVPLWLRPFAALDVLGFYAGKVLLPFPLPHEYAWHSIARSDTAAFWLTAGVVAAALGLGFRFRARAPLAWLGLLFALAALSPVLGFVPYLHQQLADVGSQYPYFPLVGIALALGAGVEQGLRRAPPLLSGGVLAALLLALAAVSFRLVPVYANDGRFYGNILEQDSDNGFAHANLGLSLLLHRQYDGALRELGAAYQLDPRDETNRINLLVARMLGGRAQDVLRAYRQQLQMQPGNSGARFEAGHLFVLAGQVPEGVRLLRQAVEANPEFAHLHCPPAEQIAFLHPDRELLRSRFAEARRLDAGLESISIILEHLK